MALPVANDRAFCVGLPWDPVINTVSITTSSLYDHDSMENIYYCHSWYNMIVQSIVVMQSKYVHL